MSRKGIYTRRRLIPGGLVAALLFVAILGLAQGSSVYWAVASSHTDSARALEEAARIGAVAGLVCSIAEADVKGVKYYRVLAGPFESRALAEAARDELRSKGWADAWLLADLASVQGTPEPATDEATQPAPAVGRTIKVGLSWISEASLLSGTDGKLIISGTLLGTGETATVESPLIAKILSYGDGIKVKKDETDEGAIFASPINIISSSGALWLKDAYKVYKGVIEVARRQGSSSLAVANVIDVEDYLLSVLPSEIGGSSPIESYKAQAVVARTEALSSAGRHAGTGWDLCDSTHCQVFKGLYGQSANVDITMAVKATEGEVLTVDGAIVKTASFHSACGGWTESCEQIWGSKLSHLTNVADNLSAQQMPDLKDEAVLRKFIETENKNDLCYKAYGYRWSAEIEMKDILNRLSASIAEGLAPAGAAGQGSTRPTVRVRTDRGAALQLAVPSNGQEYIIKGELNIRMLLGGSTAIKSGVFVILEGSKEGSLRIIGAGYGHGVGMCQEGAKAMARLGKDYKAILAHYYRGSAIGKLY